MRPDIPFKENEPMDRHCTFRTGGPADIFFEPGSEDELVSVLKYLGSSGIHFVIVGRGSNILVSDDGYRGAVIHLGEKLSGIYLDESGRIYAACGATLAQLSSFAAKNDLKGLEFAYGIPGTVGGGVLMNAGAYGGEIKDTILSARVMGHDLTVREVKKDDMDLSYRHSAFQESGDIILSAVFAPEKGSGEESEALMKELNARRAEKQPLNYPSAGSTFKRPEGNYAGTLIQECGLKGYTIGGAQVSEKHAGFIINTGSATSSDIYSLIKYVRTTVKDKTGYDLVPEVRFLGDFDRI